MERDYLPAQIASTLLASPHRVDLRPDLVRFRLREVAHRGFDAPVTVSLPRPDCIDLRLDDVALHPRQ
jgi:hypothetical protein